MVLNFFSVIQSVESYGFSIEKMLREVHGFQVKNAAPVFSIGGLHYHVKQKQGKPNQNKNYNL